MKSHFKQRRRKPNFWTCSNALFSFFFYCQVKPQRSSWPSSVYVRVPSLSLSLTLLHTHEHTHTRTHKHALSHSHTRASKRIKTKRESLLSHVGFEGDCYHSHARMLTSTVFESFKSRPNVQTAQRTLSFGDGQLLRRIHFPPPLLTQKNT